MEHPPAIRSDLGRITKERDLYRRLLELAETSEVEAFLQDALGLVVDLTGAEQGYIELSEVPGGDGPEWWLSRGCTEEEVEGIRERISRGIIAEALFSGDTIVTDSAVLDERFRERESVQLNAIQAVLCAPVGGVSKRGVVYLQRAALPEAFTEADREDAERFARFLAPFVGRLPLSTHGRPRARPRERRRGGH